MRASTFILFSPFMVFLIVPFSHLAGAQPTSFREFTFLPARPHSKPETLLGKSYTVHNREHPAMDGVKRSEDLGDRSSPNDCSFTRATRFQLSRFRRTDMIPTERSKSGMDLLSKQRIAPLVIASSSLSPSQGTTLVVEAAMSTATTTAYPPVHTHTKTAEESRKAHKDETTKIGTHRWHDKTK
jgi:hypothetical protein